LKDLTTLENVYLEQIQGFGRPDRHPLGRVITIAFFSLIRIDQFTVTPSFWAQSVKWHSISDVGKLAFDHNEILAASLEKLKRRVRVQPIGFELLAPKFTLTDLQHLYEAILEIDPKKGIDKRNFRKKILAMNILLDCEETQEGVAHRPAKLYRFDKKRYEEFIEKGFSFEI
jgi:8-oxo-dGTP diphosphatase